MVSDEGMIIYGTKVQDRCFLSHSACSALNWATAAWYARNAA
jgi:hypothetical protein